MQIKHDLKQASYFQTRCTATDKMQVGGHAHLTYRKFYTHVHHIDFEKCDINFAYTSFGKFWVSCMLQFNMFFYGLSCEEFVRIHHICEELFFI